MSSETAGTHDRVMGLDGFGKHWLAVVLAGGRFHSAAVFPSIKAALESEPGAVVVGIDIPIGFGEGCGRPADHEAKTFVGGRGSSVFPTFPDTVYAAASHSEANALARKLTGKGISQQSYALRSKIQEAETAADRRLVEVHPEVSFCALAGAPLEFSKKTWNGVMERRVLLEKAGIVLPCRLKPAASAAAPDDVLDAAAAAWTAWRVAGNAARVLPKSALASRGQIGVIWY